MKSTKSVFGILGSVCALSLMVSSSAFAYGGYAALVYNTATGIWGTSFVDDQALNDTSSDSADRATAEQRALDSCNANTGTPNTCNVVTQANLEVRPYATAVHETYATDGWVALATGPAGTFGLSGCNDQSLGNCHDNQADAENSAIKACNTMTGANNQCKATRSFASKLNTWNINGTDVQ